MTTRRTDATAQTSLNDFQRVLDRARVYVKGSLPASTRIDDGSSIRILSWNIERGHDPERIADEIVAHQPHVVCLQEVDWGNARTGSRDVLGVLAARLGMLGLYAIEFLELASPTRARRFAGAGATGNALLTRIAPAATFRIELPPVVDWQNGADDPRLPRRLRRRIRREPRVGQRCGVGAEFSVGGSRLLVCSVHLEDKAGGISGRWSQFSHVMRAIALRNRSPIATVIAGDFNTFDSRRSRLVIPDTDATALGKPAAATEAAWWKTALLPLTGYADAFDPTTWTFRIPCLFRAKLDWIAVKGGAVRACGLGARSLSDHRPIWADVELDRAEVGQIGSAATFNGHAPNFSDNRYHHGKLAIE